VDLYIYKRYNIFPSMNHAHLRQGILVGTDNSKACHSQHWHTMYGRYPWIWQILEEDQPVIYDIQLNKRFSGNQPYNPFSFWKVLSCRDEELDLLVTRTLLSRGFSGPGWEGAKLLFMWMNDFIWDTSLGQVNGEIQFNVRHIRELFRAL
jgi:hypothetical protein